MSTPFNKSQFSFNSGYVTYNGDFVARFKYNASASKGFAAFVAKNFSTEEYFGRLNNHEAPLDIAQSKGYLLPHIKKLLKKAGYPLTLEGKRCFLADQQAARTYPVFIG